MLKVVIEEKLIVSMKDTAVAMSLKFCFHYKIIRTDIRHFSFMNGLNVLFIKHFIDFAKIYLQAYNDWTVDIFVPKRNLFL